VGHPPLLVVGPDGTTRWAGRASVPPLGLVDRAPTAEEVQVPPGGALVLYSDGLVERRGESIRDGLDRLAAVFADGPGVEVDGIVAAARDPRSADDATLLAVRRDA